MGRLAGQHIRAHKPPLVTPFFERTVHNGKTFGLGPSGYDVRIAERVELSASVQFVLASTIERFDIPATLAADVKDKSSWIRRGLLLGNTTAEPNWRGFLTLELFYFGGVPLVIEAGDAIAQIVFEVLTEPTELPYEGKYQDQEAGPQPARFEKVRAAACDRHRWSEPVRDVYRTHRTCLKCGMGKTTHHDGDAFPWVSYAKNGLTFNTTKTPPCDGGRA